MRNEVNTDQYGTVNQEKKMRSGVPTRTAIDWEEAALDAIASSGLGSLSIPNLARTLGVTKGSFYWHFSTLADLVTAAVSRWQDNDRMALDEIGRIADPSDRLRSLFVQAMEAERAHSLFLSLSISPSIKVAAILRKVSDRRIQLLIASYRELGLTVKQANHQALLAYSAYIGGLHLRNGDSPWLQSTSDVREFVRQATRLLITPR